MRRGIYHDHSGSDTVSPTAEIAHHGIGGHAGDRPVKYLGAAPFWQVSPEVVGVGSILGFGNPERFRPADEQYSPARIRRWLRTPQSQTVQAYMPEGSMGNSASAELVLRPQIVLRGRASETAVVKQHVIDTSADLGGHHKDEHEQAPSEHFLRSAGRQSGSRSKGNRRPGRHSTMLACDLGCPVVRQAGFAGTVTMVTNREFCTPSTSRRYRDADSVLRVARLRRSRCCRAT
jgi:hypothetical protein